MFIYYILIQGCFRFGYIWYVFLFLGEIQVWGGRVGLDFFMGFGSRLGWYIFGGNVWVNVLGFCYN